MTPNWTLNPFGMFIRFQVHRRQEALRCILEYGPPKFPRHANLFSLSQGHEESPQRADLPVRLLSFWNYETSHPIVDCEKTANYMAPVDAFSNPNTDELSLGYLGPSMCDENPCAPHQATMSLFPRRGFYHHGNCQASMRFWYWSEE